ncbi:malate dehydrogenase (quinone) [Cellulophaga baltica]|uniref:malate dehydrogenase (quinone) n=1 Tax=Cellulophaga baltica TaxID=76594 RepID=UPI00249536AC|nr:malate dehydrogenase (quinone) [Cellulophaga baltica]
MNTKNNFTLIGAGIMSATLGVLLKQLIPDAIISIYERLDAVGAESSDAWNNAGTGHSAFCELNYTPENDAGDIDISKALKISEQFEMSKQFWAYLVKNNLIQADTPFINDIDHMSFVWGDANIKFLKKRHEALTKYDIFKAMKFSTDFEEIKQWIPLMMKGRTADEKIAATRMSIGTDVNFGAITRKMISYLETCDAVTIHLGQQVEDIEQKKDGSWTIEVTDLHADQEKTINTNFVFIGAGGGALKLLEKSGIPEGEGFGGFPVSGQFLKCNNPELAKLHEAKVYGKAEEGSPPMSVPHLDTRMLNGERSLLFGPYAGFSTKFLKNGSYFDLPLSIDAHNIFPLLSAGLKNISLTKYLIEQVVQSPEERFEALLKYYPEAKIEDWELITAGQRVQIIKKDKKEGGVLKFGTEIVSSTDKTLAALLGASPGASTAVSIMLNVLDECFPIQMKTAAWQNKLKEIFPSYGESLIENGDLCLQIRAYTTSILKLEEK